MRANAVTSEDLDQVETHDLVDALRRRFPKGLLIVTKWEPTQTQFIPHVFYSPDAVVAAGMSHLAAMQINRDLAGLTRE
jgi:hypothetical protein